MSVHVKFSDVTSLLVFGCHITWGTIIEPTEHLEWSLECELVWAGTRWFLRKSYRIYHQVDPRWVIMILVQGPQRHWKLSWDRHSLYDHTTSIFSRCQKSQNMCSPIQVIQTSRLTLQEDNAFPWITASRGPQRKFILEVGNFRLQSWVIPSFFSHICCLHVRANFLLVIEMLRVW